MFESALLLGTNLGDKIQNLNTARTLLMEKLGAIHIKSKVCETGAVGFNGNDFLNQILVFRTPLSPFDLLRTTQSIELTMGRKRNPLATGYENRIIDIDILYVNDFELHSPVLRLPHPQIYKRDFVARLYKSLHGNVSSKLKI